MKKDFWVYELLFGDSRQGFKAKEKLFFKKTPYQKIKIFDSYRFKKILTLDDVVQTTQADEFIYHEMISHVPLLLHPNPKKVLIIGGGDGGVLREVLKHPVKEAIMVEIDQDVIRACEKFMPSLWGNAFGNKRAKIIIDDGIKFVKSHKNEFDVIIVDSSDPIGPAKGLFSRNFYSNIKECLTSDGVAIFQSGSTFMQPNESRDIFRVNKKIFPFVRLVLPAVPTYYGGFFTLTLVSKKVNPDKIKPEIIQRRFKNLKIKTKYYNSKIHFASFVLPNYISNYLNKKTNR